MKEAKNMVYKRDIDNSLIEDIIAFANTNGGTIYLGIDENSNIIGLKNPNEKLKKIYNLISSITPDLTYNFTAEIIKENVIVIKILKGTNRPYHLTEKGITSEGIFIRKEQATRNANYNEIIEMITEDNNVNFEDNISINQELSFNSFKKECENSNIVFDRNIMKKLGILSNGELYTNLALIISDQNPFAIKAAVYKDIDKSDFIDKKQFENMSVFEQLHEVETFLKLSIRIPTKKIGLKHIEFPEYDFEIVREALLNSIIHRDYSIFGPVLINIYENNIEIANIGGTIKNLSLNSLKKGISALRNPKLTFLFNKLNYVEAYGTGLPRIVERYKYQKNQPKIEAIDNSFFVSLPKLEDIFENSYGELNILRKYASKNETFSRSDIEVLLNCSRATAIRKLNNYFERGILTKYKLGRNTYYKFL